MLNDRINGEVLDMPARASSEEIRSDLTDIYRNEDGQYDKWTEDIAREAQEAIASLQSQLAAVEAENHRVMENLNCQDNEIDSLKSQLATAKAEAIALGSQLEIQKNATRQALEQVEGLRDFLAVIHDGKEPWSMEDLGELLSTLPEPPTANPADT